MDSVPGPPAQEHSHADTSIFNSWTQNSEGEFLEGCPVGGHVLQQPQGTERCSLLLWGCNPASKMPLHVVGAY